VIALAIDHQRGPPPTIREKRGENIHGERHDIPSERVCAGVSARPCGSGRLAEEKIGSNYKKLLGGELQDLNKQRAEGQ